jgi:hypothetical protein
MGLLAPGGAVKRYAFPQPALDKRRRSRELYPWPLSERDLQLGEIRERQQQDLALYWRRCYEARRAAKKGAA